MRAVDPEDASGMLAAAALRHYGMDALPAARTSLRAAERAGDRAVAELWIDAIAQLERHAHSVHLKPHEA